MKTSSTRAIAVEVVLVAIALLGSAGWFGVKQVKQSIKEIKQEAQVRKTEVEAVKAQAEAEKALAAKKAENDAAAAANRAREEERQKGIEQGRNIQRSSTEGSVVALQLPSSKNRESLVQRFGEIDRAAFGLYGAAPASDVSTWKNTALEALAGKAEAQEKLDAQMHQIDELNGALKIAQERREAAEKKFAEENRKATAAEVSATTAAGITRVQAGKANEAMHQNESTAQLLYGLAWIVGGIAGIWILGLILKTFALGLPADSPASNALHTAADTFHTLLAPASVVGQTRAKRETQDILERTGTYLANLRREAPAIAAHITTVMDEALDDKHKKRIRAAYLKNEKDRAAAKAECETDTGGLQVARVENVPASADEFRAAAAKLLAVADRVAKANAENSTGAGDANKTAKKE